MSEAHQLPQPSADALLREYELCQKAAQSLEATIWQTSGAMGVGLIGALIVVAGRVEDQQPPWPAAAVIGLAVCLTSFSWLFIARRWWSIQHAYFMRMRHIEEKLGIYAVRYLQYLDDPATLADSGLPEKYAAEIARRARRRKILPAHQRFGVQRILTALPVAIFAVWALYVGWLILR